MINDTVKKLLALRNSVDHQIKEILATLWSPREYEKTVEIRAESTVNVELGVDVELVHTEVYGLPETRRKGFWIEKPFLLKNLVIECSDGLDDLLVTGFFHGADPILPPMNTVPATRFTAALETPVVFDYFCPANLLMLLQLSNASKKSRTVKVKIVGVEQAEVLDPQFDGIQGVMRAADMLGEEIAADPGMLGVSTGLGSRVTPPGFLRRKRS